MAGLKGGERKEQPHPAVVSHHQTGQRGAVVQAGHLQSVVSGSES